jgi:cytoskeletal protein RodZ
MKKKKNKPSLKEEQIKALQDIGGILSRTRNEKKISLTVISEQTCISKRLLKAIEEGNLEPLPPGIYTQGFIRRFAQALDLDGIDLSQNFPIDTQLTSPKSRAWWHLPIFQLKTVHLYLFYILVISFSVKGLSTALERSLIEGNGISIASSDNITETQEINPAQNVANQTEVEDKNPSKMVESDSLSVEIRLQDKSWLKIVVDGKTEFEGELPKGTHRTWNAKQELTVRTGNAGGVLVALNDQQAEKLGQPGQVQEVTYKTP